MALFSFLCWALIFILRNRLVLLLVLYVNWEGRPPNPNLNPNSNSNSNGGRVTNGYILT